MLVLSVVLRVKSDIVSYSTSSVRIKSILTGGNMRILSSTDVLLSVGMGRVSLLLLVGGICTMFMVSIKPMVHPSNS